VGTKYFDKLISPRAIRLRQNLSLLAAPGACQHLGQGKGPPSAGAGAQRILAAMAQHRPPGRSARIKRDRVLFRYEKGPTVKPAPPLPYSAWLNVG